MNYKNKNWLFKNYVIEKKSGIEIAKECNVAKSTIYIWLIKHNITTDSTKNLNVNLKLLTNYDWLYEQYVLKKMSAVEIADICNCSHKSVYNWLNKHEIKIRTRSESLQLKNNTSKVLQNKDWLYDQYIVQEKTIKEIEKECGNSSVQYWLNKHNIPIRKSYAHFKPKHGKENPMFGKIGEKNHFYGKKHSDETKKTIAEKNRGKNKGKDNPSWNGGKTSLYDLIRKSNKYYSWRKNVFKKDKYTCAFCGYNKGNILEADHIKPFALIIKEYCVRTMEQAYKCQELWNVDNGRTLCKNCHRKTKTWGNGTKKLLNNPHVKTT